MKEMRGSQGSDFVTTHGVAKKKQMGIFSSGTLNYLSPSEH